MYITVFTLPGIEEFKSREADDKIVLKGILNSGGHCYKTGVHIPFRLSPFLF
jgi:hypothetical protein